MTHPKQSPQVEKAAIRHYPIEIHTIDGVSCAPAPSSLRMAFKAGAEWQAQQSRTLDDGLIPNVVTNNVKEGLPSVFTITRSSGCYMGGEEYWYAFPREPSPEKEPGTQYVPRERLDLAEARIKVLEAQTAERDSDAFNDWCEEQERD